MNHWKRIVIVATILIGSTAGFGFWATHEFDKTFSQIASVREALPAVNLSSVFVPESELDSESDPVSDLSTTTESVDQPVIVEEPAIVDEPVFDQTSFAITNPQKGDLIYASCGYNISWTQPTTIESADIWIVNADTVEKVHPTKSNLIISATSTPLSSYTWWVGDVEPAQYYIFLSKVNGIDTVYRSDIFVIDRLSSESMIACPNL